MYTQLSHHELSWPTARSAGCIIITYVTTGNILKMLYNKCHNSSLMYLYTFILNQNMELTVYTYVSILSLDV